MDALNAQSSTVKKHLNQKNKPKISASGQTCGQRWKMGLFNPWSRGGQAHWLYRENARFREDLRENKRKSEVRLNLRFWSEWQDLNLRPLPPQGSALPTAPHPDIFCFAKQACEVRTGHFVDAHPLRLIHYITMFWKSQGFFAKNMKKTKKIFLLAFFELFRGYLEVYFWQKTKFLLTCSRNQSILEIHNTLHKTCAVVFALRYVINCGIYALSDIYVLACELTVNSADLRAVDFLLCGMWLTVTFAR